MINLKKGFTLIELLVVIAIIGILSAVVLASLNTARDKAADAAVKANLNNVRAQAELFYDDSNQTYSGACGNANILSALNAAGAATGGTGVCADTSDSTVAGTPTDYWVMTAPYKDTTTDGYYCVDSQGQADDVTTNATGDGTDRKCSDLTAI